MIVHLFDCGVDLIVATVAAALSVGSPQHGAPIGDNQNKSALPEMSGQMMLLK